MNTLKFAVFGNPIHHSYSPKMHHLFAQQCGIENFLYEKTLVQEEAFEQTVLDFFAQGGKGLNITVPFKLKAFNLAQHLTDRAKAAGAVNTLWMQEDSLWGDNTDGIGLVRDIQRLGIALNQKILLIGAGGASRGAILPLIKAGCTHLHIANRTESKAQALIEPFLGYASTHLSASDLNHIPTETWDIIINASASSLANASLPIADSIFQHAQLAYDMLYSADAQTAFLQQAKTAGAKLCADGLGMLVYQGAEAFQIWNKLAPNPEEVLLLLRQDLQCKK